MTKGTEHDSAQEQESVAPTTLPATSPFGITVPVNVISDRELGIAHHGAHAATTAPLIGPLPQGVAIDSDTGAHVMWAKPEPQPPASPGTLIRAGALWAGIAVLLILALVASIGALNREVFSASGFINQYLAALSRSDSVAALSFPGVQPKATALAAAGLPTTLPDVLLRDSVMRAPHDAHIVSEEDGKDGVHVVTVEYTLDGAPATTTFKVERTGTQFGVFDEWRFASSPLAVLSVNVLHDAEFSINGLTLDTRAHHDAAAESTFNNSASYLAFAPSSYELSRDSRLLTAAPVTVPLTAPVSAGGAVAATVDAQPTPEFVNDVQNNIDDWIDENCLTQTVLQPTGCPFGVTIDDRVLGEPTWSIVEYPVVTLTATDTNFEMPQTPAVAHVSVEVQSLFDGDISQLEQDEPFTMGLTVTISPSGTLNIQLN